MEKGKISCIICAYNEAGRIGRVLKVVEQHPLIDEVIVVDDGSTDQTAKVVRKYKRVRLISYAKNKGKSFALSLGLVKARNTFVMLLDADLIGLSKKDIAALAQPVLAGDVDVSLSFRRNSLFMYKVLGMDFVSGERVFAKVLVIKQLDAIRKLPGFGLEVFMNNIFIAKKCRIRIVKWDHVLNTRKSEKIGWWNGRVAEVKMVSQILKVMPFSQIIRQNVQMLALQRKG